MVEEHKKFEERIADLERLLEEAREEAGYYKRIAAETGKTRLREINQLSRLITELRRTEEELKHSEEKYRILVENSPIGIYYSDFQGRFLYGNKKAEEIVGYHREELIGKSFLKLKLLSQKDITKIAKLLAFNAIGKATGPDELTLIRKDGSKVIVEVNTEVITIEGKKVALGMVQDITERKQAEELLSSLIAVAYGLTAELGFDRVFPLIIEKVTEAMSAERTSLYIIDWERHELWTKVAEQIDQIRLPLGKGISGRVAQTGEMLNVADAWELPYFDRAFDKKHQFRTRSVLCMPIKNHVGEKIGVLQVINKKGEKRFNSEDEIFLRALTSQVGIALENSLLIEELLLSFNSSIRTLSAMVDARHPLTAGHSQRVTDYSLLIAREMGLSEDEIEPLKYAAILHDIGKIGIRDAILLKNGQFTPEERAG